MVRLRGERKLTVKEIILSNGKRTLVDDSDYEELNKFKWSCVGVGYVQRGSCSSAVLMHRQILQAPRGIEVDHVNRDPLDNRRCNLRLATRRQNECNKGLKSTNTSGYKGVKYHKREKKWRAEIRLNGRTVHIGSYKTPREAAIAYNNMAFKINGEFAYLNIIEHALLPPSGPAA